VWETRPVGGHQRRFKRPLPTRGDVVERCRHPSVRRGREEVGQRAVAERRFVVASHRETGPVPPSHHAVLVNDEHGIRERRDDGRRVCPQLAGVVDRSGF
jgi:hypothetical protein